MWNVGDVSTCSWQREAGGTEGGSRGGGFTAIYTHTKWRHIVGLLLQGGAGEKRNSGNSSTVGPERWAVDLKRQRLAMNTFMATATPGTARGLIFGHWRPVHQITTTAMWAAVSRDSYYENDDEPQLSKWTMAVILSSPRLNQVKYAFMLSHTCRRRSGP